MPHAVQQQRGAVHGVDVGVPSTPRPSQRLHLAPRPAQMEDGETAMPTPLLEKFQITRHANNVCFLFDVLAPFLLLLSYIMQCMTKHIFLSFFSPLFFDAKYQGFNTLEEEEDDEDEPQPEEQ